MRRGGNDPNTKHDNKEVRSIRKKRFIVGDESNEQGGAKFKRKRELPEYESGNWVRGQERES